MPDLERRIREADKDVVKAAMKEALHEWLNDKYAEVGKWTVRGLVAAGLTAYLGLLVYLDTHK